MRALVLSGGSSKCAYQVAALQFLINELNIIYDIYAGVSAGAINCSYLAQYKYGEEKLAVKNLHDLWSSLDNSKIYQDWKPFGKVHALWKNSFYDSSPLHKLVRGNIILEKLRSSGKKVSCGTVSLSSGKYTIFDQTSEHFIDAVIASSSFPGMLSPIKFLDQIWTDGGIKEISPIKTAIDMGATEIDVIMTSPHTRIKKFIENPNIVDILKRSFDLSTDKIMANDVEKVEIYNILAQSGLTEKKYVKINILRPDFNLIEDLLDFRPHKIQEMMEKGYADAQNKYGK